MDNEKLNELSGKILDAAIEVHNILCPGLLEIVYETCLCKELTLRNIAYKRQVLIPIIYKECSLNCDLKLDILAEDLIVVELKNLLKLCILFSKHN
jgi:GxxExxY protein